MLTQLQRLILSLRPFCIAGKQTLTVAFDGDSSDVSAMFVEATVVFVIMQMSLGLILNVIVGFSVVDGRWRGREAILDLDFTISHRCKCQFCQKRFSLRVLALRRVCKQMTIVAMRPCCKTGAKVVLRRSTTLSPLQEQGQGGHTSLRELSLAGIASLKGR